MEDAQHKEGVTGYDAIVNDNGVYLVLRLVDLAIVEVCHLVAQGQSLADQLLLKVVGQFGNFEFVEVC